MSWATVEDLTKRLLDDGVLDAEPLDTDQFAVALRNAISRFETDTDWLPFLGSGSTTRYFSEWRDKKLNLGATPLTAAPTTITLNGSTLTYGQDYTFEVRPKPLNALVDYGYIPALELSYDSQRGASDLQITGVFGRVASVPQEVNDAILGMAGIIYVARSNENAGGDLKKIVEGPVTLEYRDSDTSLDPSLRSRVEEYYGYYQSICNEYKRY